MAAHVDDDAPKPRVPLADLSALDRALERGDRGELVRVLKGMRPADVGSDLARRDIADGIRIVGALGEDDRRAAAILRSAHEVVAGEILRRLPVPRAAQIVAFLPTEVRTTLLATLSAELRRQLEDALDDDDRRFAERALALPESSVARLASPRAWTCSATDTVGQALARLRDEATKIELAPNVYVIEGDYTLVGVVALRELAVEPHDRPIAELMTRDPISVRIDDEQATAAEIIRTHDFLSLPVVDEQGRFVGAVRVDDLFDSLIEHLGADMLNQGAVSGDQAARRPYFLTPLWKVVRSRVTWLVLLFVAETATGTVLRHFEDELARVVALSFFIPLLIGTGGNAGSQTVSTIIRALALGEVRVGDVVRVVAREVTTGLMLGVLLGAIAFGRALLWGVTTDLALCVATTILVVCVWANAVGAAIPIIAQRLKIDPTVISAPLITTLVDASGLFIYLSIAQLMVSALH